MLDRKSINRDQEALLNQPGNSNSNYMNDSNGMAF